MGYYCTIGLAMKENVAGAFKKEFPDSRDLYNPAYGVEYEEKEGATLASWEYEKRDPGPLAEFLRGQPESDFFYYERDENDDITEFGDWIDNPFIKASETVYFSNLNEAFEELAKQLGKRFPKDEVEDALKNAAKNHASDRKDASPKP